MGFSYDKNGKRHYRVGLLTEVLDNKYLTICTDYDNDLLFTVLIDQEVKRDNKILN